MKKILTLTLSCLALSLSAATYYVDYASGNDASPGTSKASPWKRAPGMVGFAGPYTHTPGDRFIFKGGVTWPTACFQWKITKGLTHYGADSNWSAGAVFQRPLFDMEHRSINGWTLGAGVLVEGCNSVTFENLEFARHRAPLAATGLSIWGTMTVVFSNADECVVDNCVVRDWDQPSPMVSGASGGGGIQRVNNGNVRVRRTLLHQDNVAQKSGTALWNIAEVGRCEIRNTPTAIMYSGWSVEGIYGNHIHHLPNPADPIAHSNAILCPGGVTIRDNLIHDTGVQAQVIFIHGGYYGASAAKVFNNIVHSVTQPCIALDSNGQNNQEAKNFIWNNTLVGPGDTGLCLYSGLRNNGPIPHLDLRNNHFISTRPIELRPIVATYLHGNNLTNTISEAATAGYERATLYRPATCLAPTVNTGADLSAFFTTDYSGSARVMPFDIGAHEWTGPMTPPVDTNQPPPVVQPPPTTNQPPIVSLQTNVFQGRIILDGTVIIILTNSVAP